MPTINPGAIAYTETVEPGNSFTVTTATGGTALVERWGPTGGPAEKTVVSSASSTTYGPYQQLCGFAVTAFVRPCVVTEAQADATIGESTGGSTTFAGLSDAATVNLPATNGPLGTALAAKGDKGKVTRAADVTASRDIAAADFTAGIMPVNAAGAVALTLPTAAAMTLAGSGNVLAIQLMGAGTVTIAGKTSSTTINGVAGPTVVAPADGALVRYGSPALLMQIGSTDAWTLS